MTTKFCSKRSRTSCQGYFWTNRSNYMWVGTWGAIWASFKSCEIYLPLVPPKLVGHDDSDVEYGGEGDDDKGLQSSSSAKRLQYSADTLCFALCRKTKMLATITHRSGRGDCRMANLFLPIHQRRR